MKLFEDKSLEEIKKSNNKEEEKLYFQELSNLSTNRIARQIIEEYKGYPLSYIWEKILENEVNIKSREFFPGDIVIVYPKIKECRATKDITCDFSCSVIKAGSIYINYRPLIENISKSTSYVLKRTIKVEKGYTLPKTISELEDLKLSIESGEIGEIIDSEKILELQKLRRRKK